MNEKTWFVLFFDQNQGEVIEVLNKEELSQTIQKLSYEQLKSVYIADQNRADSNWKCITDVDEFQEIIFYNDEATEKSYEGNERRMHQRYEAHLKVLLNHGKSYFTSVSVNVSLGGLKLEHLVPEALNNKHCTIQLAIPDDENSKPLIFFGLVKNVEGQARVIFKEVANSGQSSLVDWFMDRSLPNAQAA